MRHAIVPLLIFLTVAAGCGSRKRSRVAVVVHSVKPGLVCVVTEAAMYTTLVFRSSGDRGVPLNDVSFDDKRGGLYSYR